MTEQRSDATSARAVTARFSTGLGAVVLVVLVLLTYGPSVFGGFLIYDDGWLYQNNPLLAPDAVRTPLLAFSDFSRETRLVLGAEYLPLRDVLAWLETRTFGLWAPGLHATSVLLYLAAALFFRGALLRCLGAGLGTEFSALLFALHPVHAESVAWLAGQKDVLALIFVGAALYVHAGEQRHRTWLVPLLVVAASLAKSMSVAVLGLLLAQDLWLRRRLNRALYLGCCAGVVATMAAHVYVGRVVGMVAEPLGGSRYHALISMGPVWLRYLMASLAPWTLSITHDVPVRSTWDLPAVLGMAAVVGSIAYAVVAMKRGRRAPAFLVLWFFAPLLPVSQVLVPLQNRMADRYLWLSVMAPCIVFGWLLEGALARRSSAWPKLLAGVVLLLVANATLSRVLLFTDNMLLFADGMQKTTVDTIAPYQLGQALELEGKDAEAILAYREAVRRGTLALDPRLPSASNNLARLLARRGQLAEAEQVLRDGLARFPDNPKMRKNLAKMLHQTQRHREAEEFDATPPR
ncbi:MAG: tetratricopeptide repeat protein [Myxococcales bacterium]